MSVKAHFYLGRHFTTGQNVHQSPFTASIEYKIFTPPDLSINATYRYAAVCERPDFMRNAPGAVSIGKGDDFAFQSRFKPSVTQAMSNRVEP